MGIIANFNLPGTEPVASDLFIMWVIGTAIILIECFSILLDIPSWPKLHLGFWVVSIIVDWIIGSKNILCRTGFGM